MSSSRRSVRLLAKSLSREGAKVDFASNTMTAGRVVVPAIQRPPKRSYAKILTSTPKQKRCKKACIACYLAKHKCRGRGKDKPCDYCKSNGYKCVERAHKRIGRKRIHFFDAPVTKEYVREQKSKRKRRKKRRFCIKKQRSVRKARDNQPAPAPWVASGPSNDPGARSPVAAPAVALSTPGTKRASNKVRNAFVLLNPNENEDIFGFENDARLLDSGGDCSGTPYEFVPELRRLCMRSFDIITKTA